MMAVVARYADVWNSAGAASPQEAAEKSQRLDDACRELGRDPASIRRSTQHFWDGRDRGQLLDLVGRYFELGFTEQIINLQGPDHAHAAEAAAEALPQLRRALVH
jgi:hypothetical protein